MDTNITGVLSTGTPIGVVSTGFLGLPWPEVAYMLTAAWTAYLLISRILNDIKRWRRKRKMHKRRITDE